MESTEFLKLKAESSAAIRSIPAYVCFLLFFSLSLTQSHNSLPYTIEQLRRKIWFHYYPRSRMFSHRSEGTHLFSNVEKKRMVSFRITDVFSFTWYDASSDDYSWSWIHAYMDVELRDAEVLPWHCGLYVLSKKSRHHDANSKTFERWKHLRTDDSVWQANSRRNSRKNCGRKGESSLQRWERFYKRKMDSLCQALVASRNRYEM